MKLRWLVVVVVLGGVMSAGDALAQAPGEPPPPPPPGAAPMAPQPGMYVAAPYSHVHHGLFVRMLIGPGGFDAKASSGGQDVDVSGGGGGFSLAVGGAVSESFIVYGEVFDDVALSPTVTVNGQQMQAANDVNAGVVGFGPGFAYYLPSNVYIGATFAAAKISVQQNGTEIAHSDTGFGVSAHIGKEWWVSDNWGCGIAGQVFAGSIPDNSANTNWTTVGATVAFSATYN